jgi:RNA polymerase sigma factor (sigma-70 family)
MASLSDEDILRRMQRGERSLYVELFDRYYDRVRRYARSQAAEAADELASETFLWAYRNAGCYTGEISFLGHLLRICRRLVCLRRERLPGVPPCAPGDDADHRRGDAAYSLPPVWQKEAGASAVRGALQCLPSEDREVIYLAYEADLSPREIMTILDQPSFSAYTAHLYRAMRKLHVLARQPLPARHDIEPPGRQERQENEGRGTVCRR